MLPPVKAICAFFVLVSQPVRAMGNEVAPATVPTVEPNTVADTCGKVTKLVERLLTVIVHVSASTLPVKLMVPLLAAWALRVLALVEN